MRTQRHHDLVERDDATEGSPELEAINRRALLGAAAGGCALATTGLLVPEWLVTEAEAADHPMRRIQKRQAKQRDKRRHRLEHRRQQNQGGDNNGNNTPPGSNGATLDVALYVHTKKFPLEIAVWQSDADGKNGVMKWGYRTIPAGSFQDFVGSDKRLMALMTRKGTSPSLSYRVQVWNPAAGYPHVKIAGPLSQDEVVVVDQNLSVWETVYVDGYKLQRLNDTDNHKQFQIDEL
jgi:hypothetical protein